VLAVAGVGYAALAASTSRSQLARAIRWGESDVGDHARFPARPPGGGVPPVRTVEVPEDGRLVRRDLEQFLAASDTTAFLILPGDTWSASPSARAASPRWTTPSPAVRPSWPAATGGSGVSPCGTCSP
jgi:hypothetical protein